MKKSLLLLLLLITGISNAQIVNIPDPVFKSKLLLASSNYDIAKDNAGNNIAIDINNNDEIEVSEALMVWELEFDGLGTEMNSLVGIEAFTNLRKLAFPSQNVSQLNVSTLINLEELDYSSNDIDEVDFTVLSNLKALDCSYNYFQTLNISSLLNLKYLNCNNNLLGQLILPQSPFLESINCEFNILTNLDLSAFANLKSLDCGYNNFATLDISNSPNFIYIRANNCLSLKYINLKNGSNILQPLKCKFSDCPNLSYICVDEGEQDILMQYFTATGVVPISMGSYCSFTPGGNYNTITGNFNFDANNNGCENDELIVGPFGMHITDGTKSGSAYSNNGSYNFYAQSGNFVVTPALPPGLFTVTPASATINLATVDNSTTTQSFCLTANGVHPDLAVIIVPIMPARPGFDSVYKVVYGNKGNQVLSGSVAFNYNDLVLDYVSATTVPASTVTGALTWDFADLKPFEYRVVTVTLNANGPMETPAVDNGDMLAFTATITPLSGDDTPTDNTFNFNQIVVGSFDPNDISCLEGETVSSDKIGEYLHYNINFENTGTASAEFIVVKDIIDATQFDVSTLQLVDASHNVEVRINDNKAEFIFDNINLAGSGKGNVVFKIKTLNSLAINDDVTQNANIFFDYNWPIETNDATTVFGVLSNDVFQKDASVKVYPNPVVSVINLTAETEIRAVELYDAQGRVLETMVSGNENAVIMDISNRASGLYFIKIITEQGGKVEKIIKK